LRALFALAGIAAIACLACGPASEEPGPTGPIRLLPSDAFASIGPETRMALILKPPELSQRSFEVTLPPNARLDFGFGIPNSSLVEHAAGATFRVTIEADGERQQLFQHHVDPSDPSQRHWFDVEADLSTFANRRVSLGFEVEPDEGQPPLGVFADPVVSDAAAVDTRPNVVVISLDTLRARNVSGYGYGRQTSPFFDSLAKRGALFEDAITTSVTTGPSHMSMFTGLYPVNHGLSTGLEHKADRVVTLAEALRNAGYQTAAFTEDGYIVRDRGFGRGFSEYTENKAILRHGPGEVRRTFGQARRWLSSPARAREPFHLFVHTYEVHSPYRPPGKYGELFEGDDQPGPEDPVLLRQRDNYDREIRYVDDKLRELVATLDERGLRERTLLVITADHGEEFHEHGHYQHGGAVFDESLHIPLLFLGPGIPPGRHTGQVSLIDVMPTLLDYAGVPPPPDLDGMSLLPAIRGEAPVAPRTLFAEARGRKRWLRPFKGENWSPPLIAIRTPEEKFIVHRPAKGPAEPTLHYDLLHDAGEKNPRIVRGEELDRVNAMVDEYLTSRLAPDEVPKPDSPDQIDPHLRKQLEALGYLDPE
jgi:arylsulfatase A-like enzyme